MQILPPSEATPFWTMRVLIVGVKVSLYDPRHLLVEVMMCSPLRQARRRPVGTKGVRSRALLVKRDQLRCLGVYA